MEKILDKIIKIMEERGYIQSGPFDTRWATPFSAEIITEGISHATFMEKYHRPNRDSGVVVKLWVNTPTLPKSANKIILGYFTKVS